MVALIAGLASSSASDSAPNVRSNTVLTINLSGSIPEVAVEDPFQQLMNPTMGVPVSVRTLRENLIKASADEKISGIWLKMGPVSSSWNHLYEVRNALIEFKESGKFLYASTDDVGFNEQAYYLATAADSVFSPAQSFFEFDGFYMQPYFMKNMFDKLGLEVQVSRSGSFKSAAESYTRTDLSPENELQYRAILDGSTREFLFSVAQSTGKSMDDLNALLNQTPILSAVKAHEHGFIDALMYPDQIERHIKNRMALEEKDRLNTITHQRYARVSDAAAGVQKVSTKDRIAVINAFGEIMPNVLPFGDESLITATNFKRSLDRVVRDDNVKAIVIRIDSPGGSASTSDLLYHMIKEAAEKKPVIASMSSTAASGGYYMAMGADTVIASPFTVTGSIGVISMKYNFQELAEKKLGVTFDEVKSHQYADWLSFSRPFTDDEASKFLDFNLETYERFLEVVAGNRGMTRDQVHELAQGRVWTGTDAHENGLVDILGGYDEALRVAAEMAAIDNWDVVTYPAPRTFLERLSSNSQMMVTRVTNPAYELERLAHRLMFLSGAGQGQPVTRMPVEIRIF